MAFYTVTLRDGRRYHVLATSSLTALIAVIKYARVSTRKVKTIEYIEAIQKRSKRWQPALT